MAEWDHKVGNDSRLTRRKPGKQRPVPMTTPFEIRTDVPMPGARNRYPFETMPSGASFEIVGEEEARKVRNAAYQHAKKHNRNLALAAAKADLGRGLTSDEKAAITPVEKGEAGAMEFALRKIASINAAGERVAKDAKPPADSEGKPTETWTPVYGLWRVS